MKTDKLTPELRKIEKDIETDLDRLYNSNPLANLPFATAAWYLLAIAEDDEMMQEITGINELHARNVLASEFAVNLEYPIARLYGYCKQGGEVPSVVDDDLYKAARDLFDLGKNYACFVFTYTLASCGLFELELRESTIQPVGDLFQDLAYEAYNSLIYSHESEEAISLTNIDRFPIDAIKHTLKIQDDRFRYKLNPKMVSDARTYLKPFFLRIFSLPSEWQFSRYTLGEFRRVFESICAIAHIHWTARGLAIGQGCNYLGCADGIYTPTCDELLSRVVNYSRVPESAVRNILEDLSYGDRGISHPDPALQPLIKLNSDHYAIAPHLWISSTAEVNFTKLLNKLQSEKHIYSELKSEKEAVIKKRIISRLHGKGFRIVSNELPNLPDIDLAIIMDSEQTCLLLELKWFIAPAVAREQIEKSKEIAKGISQVFRLKEAFDNNHELLLDKLKINSSYRLEGVVVSENWIGDAHVQSPEIPVIQANHLIEKLSVTESLASAMEWLKHREYLPKEGQHFNVTTTNVTIGSWTLKAPTIEILTKEEFFPW